MRDVLSWLFALLILGMGIPFLCGVVVGMVFSSVGGGSPRRGVALPVQDEGVRRDPWPKPTETQGLQWRTVKGPDRKH